VADDDQLELTESGSEELDRVGAEGEDDLVGLNSKTLSEAVLFSTDWTVETILLQLKRGTIHLNPKYQRRDAWRVGLKSRFIESLFLGLPVPPLVLAEAKGKRGSYIVIDGKQRLLTIRQFAASNDDADYPRLKLSGLEILPELNGMSMSDLESSGRPNPELEAFRNHTIRTVVIRNWPNESYLLLVFLRLNTGTVQLSPQELRQALNPGPFVDFTVECSGNSVGLMHILKRDKPDFRMRDVELLVRFYAFKNFLPHYAGNLRDFLDQTCSKLNNDWKSREKEIELQAGEFEAAIDATYQIFGKDAFRKWDGEKFESRLNRAVFDIMTYYLSVKTTRDAAIQNSQTVKSAFQRICTEDPAFRKTLESTTKSLDATRTRFMAWGQELNQALHMQIRLPLIGV
jgi:hypothetical protein